MGDQHSTWRQLLDEEWHSKRKILDWAGLPSNHVHISRLMLGSQYERYQNWLNYSLQVHLRPLQAVVKQSRGDEKLRMLSLGCGDGSVELELLRNSWPIGTLCCAEYDTELLSRAGSKLADFDCMVDLQPFDFNKPFHFGKFDVVFFCHSAHHCSDIEEFLPYLNNSLEDHGIVLGVDYFGPCRLQVEYDVKLIMQELFSYLPDHLRQNLAHEGIAVEDELGIPLLRETRSGDASEAPSSANLRSMLFSTFPVVDLRPMGGTLLRRLLANRAGNFRDEDSPILSLLQFIERTLIESRTISSDDLYFVLRKSARL